jgi:hypothetical protein
MIIYMIENVPTGTKYNITQPLYEQSAVSIDDTIGQALLDDNKALPYNNQTFLLGFDGEADKIIDGERTLERTSEGWK